MGLLNEAIERKTALANKIWQDTEGLRERLVEEFGESESVSFDVDGDVVVVYAIRSEFGTFKMSASGSVVFESGAHSYECWVASDRPDKVERTRANRLIVASLIAAAIVEDDTGIRVDARYDEVEREARNVSVASQVRL